MSAIEVEVERLALDWPPSTEPTDSRLGAWVEGIRLLARGYYQRGTAVLTAAADTCEPPVSGLLYAALSSAHRQLGDHSSALEWDQRAWQCQDLGRADAVVNIAADHLGLQQYDLVRDQLTRAGDLFGSGNPRGNIRLRWVRAELALVEGQSGRATEWADEAISLSRENGARRHELKSRLIGAVAGSVDSRGADELHRLVPELEMMDLGSLIWPCVAALGDQTTAAESALAATARSRITASEEISLNQ